MIRNRLLYHFLWLHNVYQICSPPGDTRLPRIFSISAVHSIQQGIPENHESGKCGVPMASTLPSPYAGRCALDYSNEPVSSVASAGCCKLITLAGIFDSTTTTL